MTTDTAKAVAAAYAECALIIAELRDETDSASAGFVLSQARHDILQRAVAVAADSALIGVEPPRQGGDYSLSDRLQSVVDKLKTAPSWDMVNDRIMPNPAPIEVEPWTPPEDRPIFYTCLGFKDGRWIMIYWTNNGWSSHGRYNLKLDAFHPLPAPLPTVKGDGDE